MPAIINLFKEFDLLIALLIVLVTIVLLGSFKIEFKWPGLRRNKSEVKGGKEE